MCVIGVLRINGKPILFKNRDKLDSEQEEIEINEDYIVVKSKKSKRISCGINKWNVAFVRAEVAPTEAIKLLYNGKLNEALDKTNKGIHPSWIIHSFFKELKNATEVIEYLRKCPFYIKPSIMIIADDKEIFLIETNGIRNTIFKKIDKYICKSNHFDSINFGPISYQDYPSSFEREKSAIEGIKEINTINEIKTLLKSHDNENNDFNICRHHLLKTVSSDIIIPSEKALLHCDTSPCKGKYKEYNLIQ